MPTRCTEAATCSGIRNSGSLPTDTHAGKPDRPDRTSGLEPVSLSRPSRTAKSPKPACALFAPKMPFAFASSAPASTGFSDCKQTGPFVPSQFTFARVGARSCCGAHASAPPRGPCKSNTAPQGHFMKRLHGRRARQSSRHQHRRNALSGAAAILSAHIGGITPSLPKRTAPACKEPSD